MQDSKGPLCLALQKWASRAQDDYFALFWYAVKSRLDRYLQSQYHSDQDIEYQDEEELIMNPYQLLQQLAIRKMHKWKIYFIRHIFQRRKIYRVRASQIGIRLQQFTDQFQARRSAFIFYKLKSAVLQAGWRQQVCDSKGWLVLQNKINQRLKSSFLLIKLFYKAHKLQLLDDKVVLSIKERYSQVLQLLKVKPQILTKKRNFILNCHTASQTLYVVPYYSDNTALKGRLVATVPIDLRAAISSEPLDFDLVLNFPQKSVMCYSLVMLEREQASHSSPAHPVSSFKKYIKDQYILGQSPIQLRLKSTSSGKHSLTTVRSTDSLLKLKKVQTQKSPYRLILQQKSHNLANQMSSGGRYEQKYMGRAVRQSHPYMPVQKTKYANPWNRTVSPGSPANPAAGNRYKLTQRTPLYGINNRRYKARPYFL